MKKKATALILFLSMVLALISCGPAAESPNASGPPSAGLESGAASSSPAVTTDPYEITMASGTNGGVFYLLGAAYSQLFPSVTDTITLNVEATAGTNENLRLVSDGSADISFANPGDALNAYNGLRDFEGAPATNLRAIMSGNTNYFHIITLEGSGINDLADIKGKRVSVGPTGAPYIMPEIIEAATGYVVNEDFEGQWMSHDQATEALINGDIDCITATCAIPASAYSSLVATRSDVVFLSMTENQINNVLAAHPTAYVDATIATGAYSCIKEDTRTIGLTVLVFTNDETPEDMIYELTKAMIENADAAAAIYAPARYYSLDTQKTMIEKYPFELHPGAAKYYKEVGLLK